MTMMRLLPAICLYGLLPMFAPMGWGEALPVPVDRVVEPAPPQRPSAQAVPPARVRGAREQPAAPQARWTAPTARVVEDSPAPPPVRWEGAPETVQPSVSTAGENRFPTTVPTEWSPRGAPVPEVHPRWGTHNRPRLLENRPVVRMPFREESVTLALEELSMQDFNRYVFRRNHSTEPGAVPRQRAGRAER